MTSVLLGRQAAIELAPDAIQSIVGVAEGVGQPVWRLIDQIHGVTVENTQNELGAFASYGTVVIDSDVIQFGQGAGQVLHRGGVDLADLLGRSGVATFAGATDYPLYVHLGGAQRHKSHGNVESVHVREGRLLESDGSSESRLEGEVFVFADVGMDELFELTVGRGT